MLETVWETGSSLLVNILGMSSKKTLVGKGTQHIGELVDTGLPFQFEELFLLFMERSFNCM